MFKMLKSILLGRADRGDGPIAATGQAKVPADERLYVVGDIHGRRDLLGRIVLVIEEDLRDAPIDRPRIICVGDLIDRGDDSKGVLDLLVDTDWHPAPVTCIRGNHEAMFLAFLEAPDTHGSMWLNHGGRETLASYGIAPRLTPRDRRAFGALRETVAAAVPAEHIMFLQGMLPSVTVGDYFITHAGARPGVPLERQDPEDLMWIREGFADADHGFEKVVVHGHTPVVDVEIHRHRIAIDTGAYGSNVLSCLVLEGDQIRIVST